jgi:DNA-binding response OmpR family regulator
LRNIRVAGYKRFAATTALMPRSPEVVLLVDDIRDHAVHYEAALTRHGFVVRVATTGEDALRLAREALPDCAVIDLRLPDMSGWDLCRDIRKPQANEPPAIIVLTPEVSKACAENSAKVGCNAWLAHPMHADDLVRTVRQVLNAETDAPASLDEALLGFKRCPGCESDSVRATLRVGPVQYYCCKACSFCWRAEMVKA